MATQEKTWNVANRLHSLKDSDNPEMNHIIAGADEIYDDEKGAKQSDINAQTDAALADRYTKSETYSKEQLDALITTPDANYVTVATFADLPQPGEANTIYRVSSYDGTQVDASKYALYAWNGTTYQLLAVRSAVGEVFDVSEYNSGATYETLTAALAAVPASVQKGGMSIKFILRTNTGTEEEPVYKDEYVQYRLMNTAWSSVVSDWQGVDNELTAGSRNLVESGVVQNELALGAVYDVSAKNPTAGPNSDGKWESLSALLSDANLNTLIPTAVRKGGMSIKFVQSSDNKYVQARCMAQNFTTDVTQWAIDDESVYVENPEFARVVLDNEDKILGAIRVDGTKVLPAGVEINEKIDFEGNKTTIIESPEFVEVKLDSAGKILWAIKTDGSIYYGAGVPQQVIDYIEEKISALSLDEYEDIVAFLSDYLGSDTTLKAMIDGINAQIAAKVDKVEGKSLIDAEYASTKSTTDNPEFLEVTTDSEDKVLEGIQQDGTKVVSGDLNIGGSVKVLGNMEVSGVSYKVIENPDYLAAWVDAENKVIFGLKTDGKTYVGDADFFSDIKNNQEAISEIFNSLDIDALSSIIAAENPEYIEAKTDSEDKLLAGRTPDGAAFENVGFSTPKVSINGHKVENIEDPEGRTEITTDAEDKIISYRDSEGVKHEEVGIETNYLGLSEEGMTEFQNALKESGFNPGGRGDWSDYLSNDGDEPLCLPMPRCVILNIISDYDLTQLSKAGYAGNPAPIEGVNYDRPTEVEFYDMAGNYFKKKTFMSAQGNSSMGFVKKNFSFDFFDSEYGGDAFSVKFGDLVPQDSYHLKAYYTDAFRCVGLAGYKFYDQLVKTRGVFNDYVYKRALIDFSKVGYVSNGFNDLDKIDLQVETGAKCFPDGFPCVVYQNGVFYGLYCWQIKKSRDNYHLSKKKDKNVHLDGVLDTSTLFNGNVNWTQFEVRNPKSIVYAEAHNGKYKYDSDEPGQFEIAGNNDGTLPSTAWAAGSHTLNEVVEHNGHYFINTVANNTAEPIITDDYNKDDDPDFKNKTGCGWINCTITVKVKKHIVLFSNRLSEINAAATQNDKKALFETYFDVTNLIDYLIMSDITRNYDGFSKNWQWFTYDGVKWFCGIYDLDGIFGGNFTGTSHILPLNGSHVSTSLMMQYIITLYQTELYERYAYLRNQGIIEVGNITKFIRDILLAFGEQNIEKEFDKWENCVCNRDVVLNENWEFDLDGNDNPQMINDPTDPNMYNNTRTYNAGDSCYYAQYPFNGEAIFKYKAKATVTGIKPVDSFGYRDSIYRLYNWIKKSIENMDFVYSYNN